MAHVAKLAGIPMAERQYLMADEKGLKMVLPDRKYWMEKSYWNGQGLVAVGVIESDGTLNLMNQVQPGVVEIQSAFAEAFPKHEAGCDCMSCRPWTS